MKTKVKNIFNSKGSGYLEFVMGFVVLCAILYIFMQFYFLLHAYTTVINAARVALRNVEIYGGVPEQRTIRDGVIGDLADNKRIDPNSIVLTINGEDINTIPDGKWYQLRDNIVVNVQARYYFTRLINFSVPLSVTYVGTSERLHKKDSRNLNLTEYVPIMN